MTARQLAARPASIKTKGLPEDIGAGPELLELRINPCFGHSEPGVFFWGSDQSECRAYRLRSIERGPL